MYAVTIDHLPGFEIKQVIGDVAGSTARKLNVFLEGVQMLADGSAHSRAPVALVRIRQEAVVRMLAAAYDRGANAVIGMRFAHRSINSAWVEICAYGTAVFVVPTNNC